MGLSNITIKNHPAVPTLFYFLTTELFNSPVGSTTSNGMLDVVKQFPKADGSGTFKMGIRLKDNLDGTFDLVTVLTKQ